MTFENRDSFRVQVTGLLKKERELSYEDFVKGDLGAHLDVHPLAPAFTGQATPVSALLKIVQPLPEATHAIFHASDEFQATLPLGDLADALLLFQQENGEPLKKGYPLRLLVPNGSSDCLNVKSVVKIEVVHQEEPNQEATFGFKNTISPAEL